MAIAATTTRPNAISASRTSPIPRSLKVIPGRFMDLTAPRIIAMAATKGQYEDADHHTMLLSIVPATRRWGAGLVEQHGGTSVGWLTVISQSGSSAIL